MDRARLMHLCTQLTLHQIQRCTAVATEGHRLCHDGFMLPNISTLPIFLVASLVMCAFLSAPLVF